MVRRFSIASTLALLLVSVTASAGPTITYRHLTPAALKSRDHISAPASASTVIGGGGDHVSQDDLPQTSDVNYPADSEFVFAMSRGAVLFPASDKQPSSCPTAPAKQANDGPAPAGTAAPPGKLHDGYDKAPWKRCLTSTSPTVTAHADPAYVYALRVEGGLTIQPTFNDTGDPLLFKSVATNYTSPVATTITRIGEEAAIGMALFGPVGAGATILFGEIAHRAGSMQTMANEDTEDEMVMEGKKPTDQQYLIDNGYICPDSVDGVRNNNRGLPKRIKLMLPVALDEMETGKSCWHQFPKGDEAFTNKGWLYQTIEEQIPDDSVVVSPPTYNSANVEGLGKKTLPNGLPTRMPLAMAGDQLVFFADGGRKGGDLPWDAGKPYIPVSACHAVILRVIWWSDLVDGYKKTIAVDPTEYHLAIADPRIIQKVRIDKSPRTITMQLCGARSVSGQAPNEGDAIYGAVTKEYQNVKTQQAAWEKSK